jgi:RINT-1 / TIP-1 family
MIFQQRLQFIMEVQIAILDLYHGKWKANVEKFEASHPLALAGELREEGKKVAGVAGLERLCRVYGSSTWVEDHLKDWTDEVLGVPSFLTVGVLGGICRCHRESERGKVSRTVFLV